MDFSMTMSGDDHQAPDICRQGTQVECIMFVQHPYPVPDLASWSFML